MNDMDKHMTKTVADIRQTSAILPPRIVIHGKEGTGKTTLASRFPQPVFLQIEDGCPSNIVIQSFGLLEVDSARKLNLFELDEQLCSQELSLNLAHHVG